MSDFSAYLYLAETPVVLMPTQPLDEALSRELVGAHLFPANSSHAATEMSELCRVGLLLFNDDLARAHDIVQAIGSASGSFWHAILHRREGDFSNANYWWNRTGEHPVFDELHDMILHRVPEFGFLDELRGAPTWIPKTFTAWCEESAQTGESDAALREVQRLEMKLLLQWCASQGKSASTNSSLA